YTYDALNRLSLAETVGSGGWGQSFTYDGFGNLTAKTATKGTGVPSFTATINPATNGGPTSYPAHALPDGTDGEGGAVVNGGTQYQYDHAGKRAVTLNGDYRGGTWEFVMYDFAGRRLATVGCSYQAQTLCWMKGTNVYFGGKMLKSSLGTVVATDRLGSGRENGDGERFAYYAYGEERGSSADGREKFGTYVRDSGSWDYADQRYYWVGTGRFDRADPGGMATANPVDPGTWNRFAYVSGDP